MADNRQKNDSYNDLGEDFTLESILAEFKSSAYIEGEKKTSPEKLAADADRIIAEVLGQTIRETGAKLPESGDYVTAAGEKTAETRETPAGTAEKSAGGSPDESAGKGPEAAKPSAAFSEKTASEPEKPDAPGPEKKTEAGKQEKNPSSRRPGSYGNDNGIIDFSAARREAGTQENSGGSAASAAFDDDEVVADIADFISRYQSEDEGKKTSGAGSRGRETEQTYGQENRYSRFEEEEPESGDEGKGFVFNIFSRRRRSEDDEYDNENDYSYYNDYYYDEAQEDEEPDYQEVIQSCTERLKNMKLKNRLALILCIVMAYITIGYERGWVIVSGLKYVTAVTALGLLMICVMLICMDIVAGGIADIFRGRVGGETLSAIASVAVLIDVITTVRGGATEGLPMCAVVSCSLFFAMWGESLYYRSLRLALRTACTSKNTSVVSAEQDIATGRKMVRKSERDVTGFYNRVVSEDLCERTYSIAAPVLLLASLVLALICHFLGEGGFLFCFSALLAVSASFSYGLCYVLPFYKVTKRVTSVGAAVAGWAGASDIASSDGIAITDKDIFPDGTISLSSVKIVEGCSSRQVITYTGSLIEASGSGLRDVFNELMRSKGCSHISVDNFSCYDGGGIGAVINGDRVLVGSSGFMHLMGVRLPQNLSAKNAVFTALNNELCGIFAVDYKPVNSVQNALIRLLRNRVKIFAAVRDFNLTPLMLQQKFKVSVDSIEYLGLQSSYRILNKTSEGRVSAVLGRDGASAYAETVVGGKLLKRTSFLSTIISVAGAAAGIIIIFMLCWSGAFEAVTADNILLFMLLWLIPVLLISGIANKY